MCARDGHIYYHRYITRLAQQFDAIMYLVFLERQVFQNYLFLDWSFFHGKLGFNIVLVICYSKSAACILVRVAEHVLMIISGIRGNFAAKVL